MSSVIETIRHPIKSLHDRQRRMEGEQKRNNLFINLWRLKDELRGKGLRIEIPAAAILPNLPIWIRDFLTEGKEIKSNVEFSIETSYPPLFGTKTDAKLKVGSRLVIISAGSEGLSNISTAISIENQKDEWGVVKTDRKPPYIPLVDTVNGHLLNGWELAAAEAIREMPQQKISEVGLNILSTVRAAIPSPSSC